MEIYNVEFPDGIIKEYTTNIIAENMYTQVDQYGRSRVILDRILNFKEDDTALSKNNTYITNKSGCRRIRQLTLRLKFFIRYKDGSE